MSKDVKITWFTNEVSDKIKTTMRNRVGMACLHLQSRIVQNLSKPVTKSTGPLGGRVVSDRSVAGQYPKAETTHLMKSIFTDVREEGGSIVGRVGTDLAYGLILEMKKDRSFLVRTLNEERDTIHRLLTGPIK